jgi:hypothetical protein
MEALIFSGTSLALWLLVVFTNEVKAVGRRSKKKKSKDVAFIPHYTSYLFPSSLVSSPTVGQTFYQVASHTQLSLVFH